MGSRLELHDLLEKIIGNKNVYYDPPENLSIGKPAIKYGICDIDVKHANNALYKLTCCYNLIVIGKAPNDSIVMELLKLPMCNYVRSYTADGFHHDVLKLYY